MHRFATWQLFAGCVVVWGTTWHAITYQLGDLGPEFGVAVRFAIAGTLALAIAAARGMRLRFGAATHVALAVQGTFLYGVSYVCVYHAEMHVPSGLVAVGYSASPLLAGVGAAVFFGAPLGGRFIAGGVLGIAGVALLFWPELARPGAGGKAVLGAAFTVGAVLLSAVGSLVASRNRSRGASVFAAMGFGMLYAVAAALAVTAAVGGRVGAPSSWQSWAALAWLAAFGSVVAFACFLTLQERIGIGPAGSVGVMTPMLALAVSIALEGFRPDVLTAIGAAVAVAGNALMLRPKVPAAAVGSAERPTPAAAAAE